MGYMQDGGSVLDMALRRAEPMQLANPEYQNLTNILNLQDPYYSLLFKIAEIKSKTDPKTGRYLSLGEEGYGKSVDTNKGILRKIREMDYAAKRGAKPLGDSSEDVKKLIDLADKLGIDGMMKGGEAKKKKEMYSYQEGGAVQEDAMMQDYLQSLQAQRANPFIPFDQRPPSSGEVMSSTPKGMEQGDYYMSLKNELEMENEELLRDKVQNTFDRIRLDSLYNQGAEYIERRPDDSLSFPNTPEQDYFMKKYREQMIDPMFLPQDN
mgnify:FL=1